MASFYKLSKVSRRLYSCLYVTGDKAQTTFAALLPHIDFEDRIKDRNLLVENVCLRGLGVDLEKVEKQWSFYRHLDNQRLLLEMVRSELTNDISILIKSGNVQQNELEKLQIHAQFAKDDLKILKEYLYGVEENTILKVLDLPNVLHPLTPEQHEQVLYVHSKRPESVKSHSHMESNLIAYTNPLSYYIKGDAAVFALSSTNSMCSLLLESNFTQFSNSETVRSLIVEGCGSNLQDVITLERHENDPHINQNELHLVGSSSLYSFMAYFARHQMQPSYFPLKLFNAGIAYRPIQNNFSNPSLFNISQESAVQLFIATPNDFKLLNQQLDSTTQLLTNLYISLGYHFRLVYLPTKRLALNESLRLSIQMFSCHLHAYVEVGNVSVYVNYLSKRLLFSYSDKKLRYYPKVIAGSVLRVPRLLACVLEYGA